MDNTAKMPDEILEASPAIADDSVFLDPDPSEQYRERIRLALVGHGERLAARTPAQQEREDMKQAQKRKKADGSSGKRKPQANYNSRTADVWRERGYSFEIVEHYNAFAGRKNDLFGFIDALAVGPDGIVGVQMTSKSHMSERMKKAQGAPAYRNWLASGARFVVMGWEKNKSGRYEFVERWGE